MKIIIAPDSFKEALSAAAAARAIERGIRRVLPDAHCVKVPVADGGEGTVSAIVAATAGRILRKRVCGPHGVAVTAHYGMTGDGDTAVIEMAAASGLALVPAADRNPVNTTSYGTGELIAEALRRGVRRVILGLGGTATNDGGAGMAQALGVVFLDRAGRVIARPLSGGALDRIAAIQLGGRQPALARVELLLACDVDNRLLGRRGASRVFAPQKGATPLQVERLERNLRHFARVVHRATGTSLLAYRGGGAAGGAGAGAVALAGGEIRTGVALVLENVGLGRHLSGAAVVITGEGRIDGQTAYGKAPLGVARLAARHGIPVIAVGGALSDDAGQLFGLGIDALESAVARDMSRDEAIAHAGKYLAAAGERIARWLVLTRKLRLRISRKSLNII